MAADTFSALLGLLEQGTGNNNNTWGALLNTGTFDQLDLAIAGRSPRSVTGGTLDLSASPPPAGPTAALHAILDITGTLVSNQIVQVPNLSKSWVVRNGTTGAFSLTFKTPAGAASAAIPQGGWAKVWCDGANNMYVGLSTSLRDVQWLGADGTLALPGISFSAEPASGFRRKATNDLTVVINGADVLEFTATAVNALLPLQQNGAQVIPAGAEMDYAGIQLPAGWYFTAGQAVSRTTDAPLFNALTITCTGNTHTNTTLDNLSLNPNLQGLLGAFVEGTGIQTGTTIASFASGSSLVLSLPATSSNTGITIRFLPYGQGDGSTTFNIPDRRGTVSFARDDMNGTARGLLTKNTTQGIDGIRLNAFGGEQSHTLIVAESPSHGHTATVTDPGHTHSTPTGITASSGPILQALASAVTSSSVTGSSVTGITVANSTTGGDGTHNNIPPGSICNRLIKR